MSVPDVASHLEAWRDLAEELAAELERPEVDPAAVQALLARRQAVQRALEQALQRQGAGELKGQGRAAELVSAILAYDRRSAERAAQIREAAATRVGELRARREMAAGYRRALRGAAPDGPAFCDRRI